MGIAKAYLVTYNVGQCLGWACLLYRILPYLSDQAKASSSPHSPARNPKELYAEIGYHIRLVQTAAMLEVLHAVIGLVRSNPVITAVQIMRYINNFCMFLSFLQTRSLLVGLLFCGSPFTTLRRLRPLLASHSCYWPGR
jgi:hypothetical protein